MTRLYTMIMCLVIFNSSAQTIDHTFSYQGQLVDLGVSANGSYDVAIQAFDAAMFGNTVGTVSLHTAVNVSEGIFTIADVDLGANTFDGLDVWLQISVKRTADVNYTALSPLQKMRSVPYATTLIDKGATDGQVLTFDAANGWQPASIASSTDNQNIQNLALSGTTLTVGIENGNSQNVDLSGLQDGTGTDTQNLSLSGTTLNITNGNSASFNGWDTNAADDFSGDYNNLFNKPSFTGWDTNASDDFSGNYNDLSNKPWAFDGLNASRSRGFTGIGTANPAANLHIKMTSASSVGAGIRLQTATTSGEDWYIRMPASDDLVFRNDLLDAFTIKKDTGDIEIAGELHSTVSGDADMKAYVYGRILINISLSGFTAGIITSASSSGFSFERIGLGLYRITFDELLSSDYMVLATIIRTPDLTTFSSSKILDYNIGSNSFEISIYKLDGSLADSSFSFVVYKK